MDGLKKILAMSSLAITSTLGAMAEPVKTDAPDLPKVTQNYQDLSSSRVINTLSEPTYLTLFNDQLKTLSHTKVGSEILQDLPQQVNFIITEKPEYAQEAAHWDGKNCVIYDETLLSGTCGPATLIAHEAKHAIQAYRYDKDYKQMPTEQQIIHSKMKEIETRLQDVVMKDELYNQKIPGSRNYEFASSDWLDYRRLKENISKNNPGLSSDKVERMAKTQFVIDTWQGNYQKSCYDQRDDGRSFKGWLATYNGLALQQSNERCLACIPPPNLTVDETKVSRHHQIMQEYIQRMGIDVPSDFFDTLNHDKSLTVIRNPKNLEEVGKYFNQKVKLAIMPRDDFVPVGGLVVYNDNSTRMFTPKDKNAIKGKLQSASIVNQAIQREMIDR